MIQRNSFSHKISKTIISQISNSNAKQQQTGNRNYGYDLHLTVFLPFLNTTLKENHRHGSVKIISTFIFKEIKHNTEERE